MADNLEVHIEYLKETVAKIDDNVEWMRRNQVTKDDCRDRHKQIDEDISGRATQAALIVVQEDIKDVKKPLWALGAAVMLYVVNWIMGRINL